MSAVDYFHHPDTLDRAFEIEKSILDIKRRIGENIVELGMHLYQFKTEKLYVSRGYDTFGEWYQSIGLSKTTVYRAIGVYEEMILELGAPEEEIADIDTKKLDMMLPLVREGKINQENIEEWVEIAKSTGEGDFVKELNEVRGTKSAREELEESYGISGLYILVPATGVDLENAKLISKVSVEVFETSFGEKVIKI